MSDWLDNWKAITAIIVIELSISIAIGVYTGSLNAIIGVNYVWATLNLLALPVILFLE